MSGALAKESPHSEESAPEEKFGLGEECASGVPSLADMFAEHPFALVKQVLLCRQPFGPRQVLKEAFCPQLFSTKT